MLVSGKGHQDNASALAANMRSHACGNAPPVQGPKRDQVISFGHQIGRWRCLRPPSCGWQPSEAETGLWRSPFAWRTGAPVQPVTGAFERNTKLIAKALRHPSFRCRTPCLKGVITECSHAACCSQLAGGYRRQMQVRLRTVLQPIDPEHYDTIRSMALTA